MCEVLNKSKGKPHSDATRKSDVLELRLPWKDNTKVGFVIYRQQILSFSLISTCSFLAVIVVDILLFQGGWVWTGEEMLASELGLQNQEVPCLQHWCPQYPSRTISLQGIIWLSHLQCRFILQLCCSCCWNHYIVPSTNGAHVATIGYVAPCCSCWIP